jgi:hypothetical protein
MNSSPKPTMIRKDQKRAATWGTVLQAACWICSGVASVTFSVKRFSSRA